MHVPPRLIPPAPPPVPGIVHLGPGAFFRAFLGTYTQDAVKSAGGPWGIAAVSLRSPGLRDALALQGCAYTAVELAEEGPRPRIITVITGCRVAPEDPGAVIAAMADPDIRMVSLTITEKGYCHNPATGALTLDHPDICRDLSDMTAPVSAIGFIVAALARRRAAGHAPFTVLSCDNLPDNGALTRRVVLALATEVDPELAAWIATHARFPATMVDRITPATTKADIAKLAEVAGYHDPACVMHEPFRQWVIEDDFVGGARPAWDRAGAEFVRDVAPFEAMKLRCLNGTHSMLAYLGYLAGHETIAEAVAAPDFAQMLERVWAEEILPTVPPPEGTDLRAYCAALAERYRNPAIRHRTWQIAMDGSQKLPQRLLGTISDNLAAGRACPLLTLAVAGWMRYVGGVDEAGELIEVKDPMAEALRVAYDSGESAAEKVAAFLALREIFEADLAANAAFMAGLTEMLERLITNGVAKTLREVLDER